MPAHRDELFGALIETPPPRDLGDLKKIARFGRGPLIFVTWIILVSSGFSLLSFGTLYIRDIAAGSDLFDNGLISLLIIFLVEFLFGLYLRAWTRKDATSRVTLLVHGELAHGYVTGHGFRPGWNLVMMRPDHIVHVEVALPDDRVIKTGFRSLVSLRTELPVHTEIPVMWMAEGDRLLFPAALGLGMNRAVSEMPDSNAVL